MSAPLFQPCITCAEITASQISWAFLSLQPTWLF